MYCVCSIIFLGCEKKRIQTPSIPKADTAVVAEIEVKVQTIESRNTQVLKVLPEASELRLLETDSLLKIYYNACRSHPDSMRFERLFFEAFPSSFHEFESLYGYDGSPNPLYDDAVAHIMDLLPSLKSIDESAYYRKLINLGICGHWDADAINYLQRLIHSKVLVNPDLSFKILKLKSTDEVESFFYFFFHGIHAPFDKIPVELEAFKSVYPELFVSLQSGFERGFADSRH